METTEPAMRVFCFPDCEQLLPQYRITQDWPLFVGDMTEGIIWTVWSRWQQSSPVAPRLPHGPDKITQLETPDMSQNQYVIRESFATSERTEFPSLEDSPLWADDYGVPEKSPYEETPPLIIIRAHYPNIAKSIEMMWGEPELDDYFHKLLMGERQNHVRLPKEVMEAILKLNADHFQRFKFEQKKPKADSWNAVGQERRAIN